MFVYFCRKLSRILLQNGLPKVTGLHRFQYFYHLVNSKVFKSTARYVQYVSDFSTSWLILRCAICVCVFVLYLPLQVELLHLLVTVPDADEGAWLRLLLRASISLHLVPLFLPAAAHKIHTWRRAKEPVQIRRND